ncbi:hypothetical protein [Solitalea canadensis]|uniref:ZU5 domain-containing protein n=1 Tax=Solitalea canadensis (strain ATCC 29591 / DSM 3403 / JCM 21819 / LMG 8368 / NBRC 15130 / NCIMB 12057 / USAM 9D) TaxID=929556 RepID=H8KPV7_SOLCM|nr:hypothetical protein [Solitalea canadensis]AFD06066.1 hypothetical protein Solca_0954 [Solitalea canadensis DSM 3403]
MNYFLKTIMRLTPKVVIFCLLYIGISACTKKDIPDHLEDWSGQGATPKERPFGTPIGQATVKQIGPEGGMLASDDGILQVVVPPGTIPKQVDFSIQPITNTLEGSPGIAYRILPEGLIFLKPVSITFDLQEAGIETEVSDLLFLAYQDKKGHHYLASDTELDKAGKKLTVKTTHFSDWVLAQLFELEVSKEQVSVGDTTSLRLMWHLGSLLEPLTKDQPIGDLVEYSGNVSALRWSIGFGKGTLKASGPSCIYTAPSQVPIENPAQISVTVPVSFYSNKRNSIVMISTPIHTAPDDYMIIKVDGKEIKNKAPENGESAILLDANNFSISAHLEDGYDIGIVIPGGPGAGSYPFGEDYKKAYIDLATNEEFPNSWITQKQNCFDCDLVYSEGQVKITKFGGIGEYVEGEFNAEVWRIGQYNPPKKKIEGKFRAKRAL